MANRVEIARDSSLSAVSDFDQSKLKKAETAEKNSLPSMEAIAQEMEHIKFKVSSRSWCDTPLLIYFYNQDGIETYNKTQLSQTLTIEKNALPTKEVIAMEKSQ